MVVHVLAVVDVKRKVASKLRNVGDVLVDAYAQKAQADAHNENKSKDQWSGQAIQCTPRIVKVLLNRMERASRYGSLAQIFSIKISKKLNPRLFRRSRPRVCRYHRAPPPLHQIPHPIKFQVINDMRVGIFRIFFPIHYQFP